MRCLKCIMLLVLAIFLFYGCGSSNKSTEMTRGPEALMAEGDMQFNAGSYNQAIKSYESVIYLHPTSDMHVDAQLKIAECHAKMEDYETQMDILLQLLRENIIPERVPEIYIQIGRFYERAAQFNPGTITTDTTDYKTAIDYYTRAVKYKDSDDNEAKSQAHFRRALVEAKIGNINKAIQDYQLITERYPNNTYVLLAQVKLLNPGDTSEPATDETSLTKYRQQLGLEPQTEEAEPIPEETEEAQPDFIEEEMD